MNYFLNRYEEITGDNAETILSGKSTNTLRINTLKTTEEELKQRLKKKGVKLKKTVVPLVYEYEAPFSLGSTEEYLLGQYYLQELASTIPVLALTKLMDVQQKTILDMTAAPGSKTTQLAAAMNNTGVIIALDTNEKRGKALANNLERCGVTNTEVYKKDAKHIQDFNIVFDAVLLDAPCSGNFCMDKRWFKKRKMSDAKTMSVQQKKLLQAGLKVLKPGGILVYSTCSLEPEENEELINNTLSKETILTIPLTIGEPGIKEFNGKIFREDMIRTKRFWPHKQNTQGFFVAAIKKPEEQQ